MEVEEEEEEEVVVVVVVVVVLHNADWYGLTQMLTE